MGPRWDGHGQGTKTSASLYVNMEMMNKQEMIILMRAFFKTKYTEEIEEMVRKRRIYAGYYELLYNFIKIHVIEIRIKL